MTSSIARRTIFVVSAMARSHSVQPHSANVCLCCLLKQAAPAFWEKWIAKWEKQGAKDAREGLNLVKNMIAIVEKEYPQEMLDVPVDIQKHVDEIEARIKAGKAR